MDRALEQLLKHQPAIWRAGERRRETGLVHVASGFPTLDAALPGGGWPLGALTEILHEQTGIGELRLLMPALARLSRRGRWIALIAPPYLPYAPALAGCGVDLSRLLLIHPGSTTDALWSVEQALRSGTCGAVLAWPRRVDASSLRRLQLAAETGRSLGLVFRRQADAAAPSPAALRLRLQHREGYALVTLLKCRGGGAGRDLALDLSTVREPAGHQALSTRPATVEHPVSNPPQPAGRSCPSHGKRNHTVQMDLPLDRPMLDPE